MVAAAPTVLITGSSGLIGSTVARRLAGGFQVVGFDIEQDRAPVDAARCLGVDLTSASSLAEGVASLKRLCGGRLASVIHLVAHVGLSGEPSDDDEGLTIGGTRRLMEALSGLQVEQYIYGSTILVHAPCRPDERINEDWPLEPKWAYPRSKLAAEDLVRSGRGAAVIMRLAGVYNDHCRSASLSHQILRTFEGRPTARVYPGDSTHGRARIHAEDVAEAMRLAIERRAQLPAESTLLIGEPRTVSYGELQRELWRLIHGEERDTVEISKFRARANAWLCHLTGGDQIVSPWIVDFVDDNFTLDVSRARERLGWEPTRSLLETLPLMTAFLKHDPVAFYAENRLTLPAWLRRGVMPSMIGPIP